jgi:hypothetical protein
VGQGVDIQRGRIAQLVERGANNAAVLGSSPSMTTVFAPPTLSLSLTRWVRTHRGIHIALVPCPDLLPQMRPYGRVV